MKFHGNKPVVYDRNRTARDSAVGAYVCQWKALERTCAGIFLEFEDIDLLFVCHNDEVETLDLARCCLRKTFDS